MAEIYSRLYLSFEGSLFSFEQAMECLGEDADRLNVAFSRLHSARALTIFRRSRPRVYRLLDPANLMLLVSGNVNKEGVDDLGQERYLSLILGAYREVSKRLSLKSLAIYGSVARGTAREDSDIDIMVISDDFHGSLGKRLEGLLAVEDSMQDELEWLAEQGIVTRLSFYPLRTEEARRLPDLFLDLTEDSIILYDEDRLLEALLLELKAKLLIQGAVRKFVDEDHWYWDLRPGYSFGEEIEIP